MYRDHTKVIKIGDRVIGGGNPILIQSMTNTKTSDIDATVAQILKLEKAGCDIIRSTVNDRQRRQSLRSRNRSIFRWLQTFILITVWRSQRLRREQIRSVSIRVISVVRISWHR